MADLVALRRELDAARDQYEMWAWLWIGAYRARGYGCVRVGNSTVGAHRAAYEAFVGAIPAGLHIDHLCRNPSCVNPAHLEPVTNLENARRGIAGLVNGARQRAITHCPRGHKYSDTNTYWHGAHRYCRVCNAASAQRRRDACR